MTVEVTYPTETTQEDASRDLASLDLHAMELDIPPVDNSSHWHSFDAVFYLLDGELHLTDVASGKVHHLSRGARVSVPARTLHSEMSAGGYRLLLGTSRPPETFEDPVNLSPEDLK